MPRTLAALLTAAAIMVDVAVVVWRIHGSRRSRGHGRRIRRRRGRHSGRGHAAAFSGRLVAEGPRRRRDTGWYACPAGRGGRLAEVTAARWREEVVRRRIVTPAPVTVRWHWAAGRGGRPRREVTMPPVPGAGPPTLPGASAAGELLESLAW